MSQEQIAQEQMSGEQISKEQMLEEIIKYWKIYVGANENVIRENAICTNVTGTGGGHLSVVHVK